MLHQILFGVVIFGLMNGLMGSIAARRAPHLEQKLAALWRTLAMQGLALAALFVGIAAHVGDAPRLARVGDVGFAQISAHLAEWRGHALDAWLSVAALAFLLFMLVPVALHVVTEARAFVTAHRADLLGRDQAATWVGPGNAGSKAKPEGASTR